ncbi:MAG: NYN domain-containing protein [Pseudomonadales bacterium]
MNNPADADRNLALFCDFENVALGVEDAKFPKFDMRLVLERLLLKGNIVVKKAYCDWDRYKSFKPAMHDAAFELIEIPHTRQSGKNSADIRMVVDALDLCYTKDHIDTFVIISGDSDFSPLVSKLRENAKLVIGVGVRNSTSDLLMNNCDEFLFYDDLVQGRSDAKRKPRKSRAKKADKADGKKAKAKSEPAKEDAQVDIGAAEEGSVEEALDLVLETAEDLIAERGDRVFGSMVKQTLRRRRPGFSEATYGFRSFGDLLEYASDQGFADIEMDERSGGYVIYAIHRG